tara:strand:- start:1 stop:834 length:834 start_codon:yes stop_codon:yes gene_type:complete
MHAKYPLLNEEGSFIFSKEPPPGDSNEMFPNSNVKSYSGNFMGTLAKSINLNELTALLVQAVKNGSILGMRYFDATTQKLVSEGDIPQIKKKKTFTTKRKRRDFDHQISISYKKGVHVKLFRTGKMLIPACGTEEKAKEAFQFIAGICNTTVKAFVCNNMNIRLIFPKEIDCNKFFNWMIKMGFSPTKSKRGRIKIKLWWNNNYYNVCRCRCHPTHCSAIPKNKRGFEHMFGKCTPSTVLFGKKSAIIFGTHFETQRKNLVWTLTQMTNNFEKFVFV